MNLQDIMDRLPGASDVVMLTVQRGGKLHTFYARIKSTPVSLSWADPDVGFDMTVDLTNVRLFKNSEGLDGKVLSSSDSAPSDVPNVWPTHSPAQRSHVVPSVRVTPVRDTDEGLFGDL